jgi:hypothetical protein
VHGRGFESLPLGSTVAGSNFCLLGINGCVVHGRGFEYLTFWGQWWCSAWSWVRICDFWGSMVV